LTTSKQPSLKEDACTKLFIRLYMKYELRGQKKVLLKLDFQKADDRVNQGWFTA
jgi:hypothetical protein